MHAVYSRSDQHCQLGIVWIATALVYAQFVLCAYLCVLCVFLLVHTCVLWTCRLFCEHAVVVVIVANSKVYFSKTDCLDTRHVDVFA
jgi:hypothetical protein